MHNINKGKHKHKPVVLFLCKQRISSYGNSYGLINSAAFVAEYLKSIGIEAYVEMAVDGNDIDKIVTRINPTHVIIHALFITPAKMYELLSLARHKHRKQVVRIHSKAPFLANEGIALPWLVQYVGIQHSFDNFIIAPNTPELTKDLIDIIKCTAEYLPNIYQKVDYGFTDPPKPKYSFNIGCFGSIRPMKNHLIQAMAAIQFAKKNDRFLFFHINGDRFEQMGDNVHKNIMALFDGAGDKYHLVHHPQMEHNDFIRVVKSMDIGMQVSLSESFNIVAADFVSNGVPLVGSPDIEQLNGQYKANPNSSEDIVDKLSFAWKMKPYNTHWFNYRSLEAFNCDAMKIWRKFIKVK